MDTVRTLQDVSRYDEKAKRSVQNDSSRAECETHPKTDRSAKLCFVFGYEHTVGSSMSNVEVIRSKEGAARALHETCLTKESDPTIGSAESEWLLFVVQAP